LPVPVNCIVTPGCGWLGGATSIVTSKITVPGSVGLKVTVVDKVFPGLRVKGPGCEIENRPPMDGIDPDRTPLPLFRSTIVFFAELPLRMALKVTFAGAASIPAAPVPARLTSTSDCAGSLLSISTLEENVPAVRGVKVTITFSPFCGLSPNSPGGGLSVNGPPGAFISPMSRLVLLRFFITKVLVAGFTPIPVVGKFKVSGVTEICPGRGVAVVVGVADAVAVAPAPVAVAVGVPVVAVAVDVGVTVDVEVEVRVAVAFGEDVAVEVAV